MDKSNSQECFARLQFWPNIKENNVLQFFGLSVYDMLITQTYLNASRTIFADVSYIFKHFVSYRIISAHDNLFLIQTISLYSSQYVQPNLKEIQWIRRV